MTLVTNLLNNLNLDFNSLSIGLLGGITCFIGGSIIKNIWFTDLSVNTTLETPTTESGVDTIRALSSNIPSPTVYFNTQGEPQVYHLTRDNLRSIQSVADQLANLNSSSTLNLHSSSRILESWDSGTHTVLYPEFNVEIIERTVNATDLLDAGKFDQLSNIVWANTQNSADILTSTAQLLESTSLF